MESQIESVKALDAYRLRQVKHIPELNSDGMILEHNSVMRIDFPPLFLFSYQSCASSSSIFSFVASPRLKAVALPQAVPRRSACA